MCLVQWVGIFWACPDANAVQALIDVPVGPMEEQDRREERAEGGWEGAFNVD